MEAGVPTTGDHHGIVNHQSLPVSRLLATSADKKPRLAQRGSEVQGVNNAASKFTLRRLL